MLFPSYPSFAIGFLLWGAGGALVSGALEALVFTELDRLGAADRYARILGRARTAGVLGVLVSGGLAGPALAAGGYPAVGAASVLACVLAAGVAARFPEHRPPTAVAARTSAAPEADDADELGWWDMLRAGVTQARTHPPVRAAVLLVAVVTADWGALDEYTPLLARDTGIGAQAVPLLLLLLWAGVTVGGLLAPAGERLTGRGYAGLLAVVAVALAGVPSSRIPPDSCCSGWRSVPRNWPPCWPTPDSRPASPGAVAPPSPRWPGWPPTCWSS
ncbi:hypothetical protein GCM10027614_16710 [Micromonospora vulcania]